MKKFFERICNKFLLETIAAPMRATWVLGARCLAKSDVRREFIANLRAIKEVAQLRGDTEVVALCNGRLTTEIATLQAELESLANEGIETESE